MPLTNDLTSAGLITEQNGWTRWRSSGSTPGTRRGVRRRGGVADDLVDPAFVTPVCP